MDENTPIEDLIKYEELKVKIPPFYNGINLAFRFYHSSLDAKTYEDCGIKLPDYSLVDHFYPNELNLMPNVTKGIFDKYGEGAIKPLLVGFDVLMTFLIKEDDIIKFVFRTSDNRKSWIDSEDRYLILKKHLGKSLKLDSVPDDANIGYINIIFRDKIPFEMVSIDSGTVRSVLIDGVNLTDQLEEYIAKNWIWG